jgi:DNA primase
VIEEAKARVETTALAERLCGQMRRTGDKWVARCPLPDHNEQTPSFTVWANPEKGWYCFGCGRGGDVITLAQLSYGLENPAEAAGYILLDFGHEIPPRPDSWFAKQERQAAARRADEEARIEHLQRRVFKWYMPLLEAIEDEDERLEESRRLWEAARVVAVHLWAGAMAS